jgi:hypothetical protein
MVRSRIGRVAKSEFAEWYLLRLENKVVKWSVYLKKYFCFLYNICLSLFIYMLCVCRSVVSCLSCVFDVVFVFFKKVCFKYKCACYHQ